MQAREINALWSREFPECPPVGFLFRHMYRDRWVRVRSLPGDRVRPESEEDYAEICRRQNALLLDVYSAESTLILITTSYSQMEEPRRDVPLLEALDPEKVFLQSVGVHELALEFDSPTYWHLFASERSNAPGALDKLMRVAAEESLTSGVLNMILLGPESKRLVYFRSGAAEIVMESEEARDGLQARFVEWRGEN